MAGLSRTARGARGAAGSLSRHAQPGVRIRPWVPPAADSLASWA